MDTYETTWRARVAAHGLTDVDWYIWVEGGRYERYATLAEAERRTLEIHGEPSCGRGAACADIAPFLGVRVAGAVAAVEAILEDEYDDDA